MRRNVLKFDTGVLERLRAHHLAPGKREEALSYVWARAEQSAGGTTVLVPHNAPVLLLDKDCYERHTAGNVRLAPEVLNGMLVQFAASDSNCLINFHDHWFDVRTAFSSIDDRDDLQFDRFLRRRFEPMLARHEHIGPNRPIHNVSVVLAQEGLDARLVDVRRRLHRFRRFDEVVVLGRDRSRLPIGREAVAAVTDLRHARQGDFIGAEAQSALRGLRVLIAGCGGLGSILAEGLARTGVGAIDLVDDDTLSVSNLNRWQGGVPCDIGASKAQRLKRRLARMVPDAKVRAFPCSIYAPEVENLFGRADLIIGALDNDEARYFLNRVAAQYLLPYFDAGVVIDSGRDGGWDFRTRMFAILPGQTACLECSQVQLFDREATLEAYLDEATAQARRAAGYVRDRPALNAPSVYALNLRASGLLITELLNYVCQWRPTAFAASESWRQGTFQRYDSENFPERPDPECPVCHHYAGSGSSERLPRPHWVEPKRLAMTV